LSLQIHDLTRFSLEHPRAHLALLAGATLLLALGVPKVQPEYGYRVLIGDEHPAIQSLDAIIAEFGGGLPVQIGWSCEGASICKNVFDPGSLLMADAITRSLESADGIRAVRGPANSPVLVPAPDGFSVRTLVADGEVASDLDTLLEAVRQDPFWKTLISRDERVTTIQIQARDTTDEVNKSVVAAVEEALVPFRARGVQFHLCGDSIENVLGGRALTESSARLVPLTVAAIFLVLLLLSRSLMESVLAVATMGVAYFWTFGLLGWLDWPQDGILEVLAPLILVIGICDSMHYLARASELRHLSAGRASRMSPLLQAAEQVALPCFFTSLTTAAAFLSFTLSDLGTFVRFGSIATFGVMACYFLTFTLLPILAMRATPGAPQRRPHSWNPALNAMASACERRAPAILILSVALLTIFGYGWATRLRVNTDWLESWGEASELVRSSRFLSAAGLRSESLEVSIELPGPETIHQPGSLERIELIEREALQVSQLEDAFSLLDLLRRVNRLLHNDDPTFERIGASPAENGQLLELVAMNEPDLLSAWLSLDHRSVRLSLTQNQELSQREAAQVIGAVTRMLDDRLPSDWNHHLSGEIAITHDWLRDVQRTQVLSFPSALVLVFGMLAWFFRSVSLAAAATIPTLLPVVVTLGAMAWVGLSLDVGRTMIAAVVIGIGVDHSVHLLDAYRRRRHKRLQPRGALREALLETGRPIVLTTIALALGFLTLLGSAWQTISSFGFFVSAAMVGALLATIFVVPSLILVFARDPDEPAA